MIIYPTPALQNNSHPNRPQPSIRCTHPTGPQCHFCHVKIPAPWIDKVADKQPATDKESELLTEHWMDEKSPNSRLGCQVRARSRDAFLEFD